MSKTISRALLGMIVDEVFDGAIEDASVIAEIYAVIKREEDNLSAADPVKPYGYVYESTVRYFDGRGPHRKVDFSYTKKNIPDDDIEEFEISETAVYMPPPAPSVAVKALEWRSGSTQHRQVASVFDRPMYEVGIDNGRWYWLHNWNGLALRRVDSENEAKAAAQSDYDARILSALSAQVQDVAGLERLRGVTYAIQHNPHCPAKYLVRLVGKSGRIDLKPYGNHLPRVKHETGDILGFGRTLDEAIGNALAAAAPAKQEGK